jgi:hypothetical protein
LIEGNSPFRAKIITIDSKGNSHSSKDEVCFSAFETHKGVTLLSQPVMKDFVVGARFTGAIEHFVKWHFHTYKTNAF